MEVGVGKLIKGLDKKILGMTEGEQEEVNISPEEVYEAYGEENPNFITIIPYETFK